jgi:6-phosphofructokinase 1
VQLAEVADIEHFVPAAYITEDGYGITPAARRYLQPLIEGEDYPPYRNGLPDYVRLRDVRVSRQLPPFDIEA